MLISTIRYDADTWDDPVIKHSPFGRAVREEGGNVMIPEQKTLARHRFVRAELTLKGAIDELSRKNFRLTVNRAYYSVFYAMRAFLAAINKDSSNLFQKLLQLLCCRIRFQWPMIIKSCLLRRFAQI